MFLAFESPKTSVVPSFLLFNHSLPYLRLILRFLNAKYMRRTLLVCFWKHHCNLSLGFLTSKNIVGTLCTTTNKYLIWNVECSFRHITGLTLLKYYYIKTNSFTGSLVFCRIAVLNVLANFTVKHLWWSSIFSKTPYLCL